MGESKGDAATAAEAEAADGEKGLGVESSATSTVAGTCGGGRVGDTSNCVRKQTRMTEDINFTHLAYRKTKM
jgi:hypothetical protein